MNRLVAKNQEEIDLMRKAGQITKEALLYAETLVRPGISTFAIDKLLKKFIITNLLELNLERKIQIKLKKQSLNNFLLTNMIYLKIHHKMQMR